MPPIDLSLTSVSKHFGGALALDRLTLEVKRGEFVSLLGPSGCGKTTALRLIAGYEQPDSGDLQIRGRSMKGVPAHRRNVGMVFQSYALFPHLTVSENIAFGLQERGSSRQDIADRVAEMLRLIRLEGLGERYSHQLSGGQQQRVALARALVIQPDLLLLDEPLSNLDAQLREEMRVEIKQLQARLGITTVFVTHDQVEALSMSSRVVVMSAGRTQQMGTPSEVYGSPTNRFVFEFLGGTNLIPGKGTASGFLTHSGLSVTATTKRPEATWLGIRPEAIHLPLSPTTTNCFPAVMESVLYRGWNSEAIVRLESGDVIRVIQATAGKVPTATNAAPGEKTWVSWSPDDCHLLTDG